MSGNGYQANARYTPVVGHGGVPNLVRDEQAGVNQDAIRWAFSDYYRVGDDKWGLGGFAVLTFAGPELRIQHFDEYGKECRTDPPLGYPSEAASVQQVLAATDDRARARTGFANGPGERRGRVTSAGRHRA